MKKLFTLVTCVFQTFVLLASRVACSAPCLLRVADSTAARVQGWVERDTRNAEGEEGGGDEDADLDEDEEYLSRADCFEAEYNFRFQVRCFVRRRTTP